MRRLLRKKRSCAVQPRTQIMLVEAGRDYTRAPRRQSAMAILDGLRAVREVQHDVAVLIELAKTVIASLHDHLSATVIMVYRDTPVEQFITDGMHQQVTIHPGWLCYVEPGQLHKMVFGQDVFFTAIEVFLRAQISPQSLVRRD